MSLFSKKDKLPYKIKLVERIQYLAGSEQDLQKLEQRKQDFIEEAKVQLVEQATKKKLMIKEWGEYLTDKEKEIIIKTIDDNPFFDVDKDFKIPYYNIRRAIRRAHAY